MTASAQLAAEFKLPVYVFCEDVAASGGYWLACAGDEIYADDNSVVGSIGVISAGFGFVETIRKLGVERRVYASGENKAVLDPFQPEKPEDVARLKDLQADVHQSFKDLVRHRRAGKLKEDDPDLFTGAFWTGRRAQALGLDRRTGPPARGPPSEIRRKACNQNDFGSREAGACSVSDWVRAPKFRNHSLRHWKHVHYGPVSAYDRKS